MTSPRRHELVLPDLDLPGAKIVATSWLADVGSRVYEGDRLLEVCAGVVTIDLPAPATGILIEQRVSEEVVIAVGQVLGVIEEES